MNNLDALPLAVAGAVLQSMFVHGMTRAEAIQDVAGSLERTPEYIEALLVRAAMVLRG